MTAEYIFIAFVRAAARTIAVWLPIYVVYAVLSAFVWAWLAAIAAIAGVYIADHYLGFQYKAADLAEQGARAALSGLRGLRAKLGV